MLKGELCYSKLLQDGPLNLAALEYLPFGGSLGWPCCNPSLGPADVEIHDPKEMPPSPFIDSRRILLVMLFSFHDDQSSFCCCFRLRYHPLVGLVPLDGVPRYPDSDDFFRVTHFMGSGFSAVPLFEPLFFFPHLLLYSPSS